ncbi:MAG: peptidase M20 [Betaproteobacteria bacterium RIFCSPLOWO2_12_FULL_65_14]|nr:MAG: peptidase M20 [Betaproteobacteria bacterium RIFCSPLOWO2_12_FULL_65_14]
MSTLDELRTVSADMAAWRHRLHAQPETAFEEHETSHFVAGQLRAFGVEVHAGIAKTGVVGVIRGRAGTRAIGLRADMDALHVDEATGLPYASRVKGKMHACGHDGHTAMLLGAARHLAATRRFAGTVYVVFQPAEENEGGGRAMVQDGLFDRFPMEGIFGLHNIPGIPEGQFGVMSGPTMASYDIFEIRIRGRGGHAAMPQHAADPVVIGAALVQSLQTVVSRSVDPLQPAVLSVTEFHAGDTWNAIPEHAVLRGTVRTFDSAVQDAIEARLRRLCEGAALAHGAAIDVRYERRYPPTVNSAAEATLCARVAEALVGPSNVLREAKPLMAAEDFAFMLHEKPGAYAWIGNGVGAKGGCMVHNPGYDFNDAILALGAAYWVCLAEAALEASA